MERFAHIHLDPFFSPRSFTRGRAPPVAEDKFSIPAARRSLYDSCRRPASHRTRRLPSLAHVI